MSTRTTFPKLAIAMLATLAVSGQSVWAQSADKAEALNAKGKGLFKERRYLEAYRAFKEATELSPQGRYYFNLCFSLNYLERFQEAIDACEQVEANGADEKLMKKTNAVLGALRAKVPATPPPDPVDPNNPTDPVDPNNPTDPVDPNNPTDPVDPNNPTDPVDPNAANTTATSTGPATVPGLDPFAVKKPSGAYEWSIGGGIAPLTNLGVGRGDQNFYAGNGVKLGLFANFMYKEAQRIGLQGYFGVSTLPEDQAFDPMTILDFGGAAYKHIKLAGSLDLTPLIGLNISLLQPEPSEAEALVALGAKAQLSLDWAFGKSKEHVLSFAPSLNLYSAGSDSNTLMASNYGLDSGGAALAFTLGYQYRFTTPFGSSPLFTLE